MPYTVFKESKIITRKTITSKEVTDNQRKYGRLQVGKDLLSLADENTVIEVIVRTV